MADRATARSISRTLPRSSSRISRWFSPGSRPWGFVVISIPFGGAQLRAAGPRVRLDLVHRGSQRSSCQQRDQVGRSASAPGEAPGADTAVRETAQRRFDEAIFEGVEREKDESPPGLQRLDRVENEPFESIELFIDRDAERLALLAIFEEDPRQLLLVLVGDDSRCAVAVRAIHPHVELLVTLKRE